MLLSNGLFCLTVFVCGWIIEVLELQILPVLLFIWSLSHCYYKFFLLLHLMAEVHVIGQIVSAKDFPKTSLFCKWSLQYGNNWKIISGKKEGQTQVESSVFDNTCKWCYPLDFHFATNGIQGWPKLYLQVYHLDWVGRSHLFGYGYIAIPAKPGTHTLHCFTWRPFGSIRDRFVQFFMGGGPQLKYPDLVFTAGDRYKLNTESMGMVTFELNVILRNLNKFGVEYK